MSILPEDRALWLCKFILPHEGRLRYWLALRTLLSRHDIDDIIQETYALLATLKTVAHIRDPRSYLFQTAKSVWLQQVRHSKVVQLEAISEIDSFAIPSEESDPETATHDCQQLNIVMELIAKFPRKCREAFVMRKFYGFSQREIAQRLGISENTVEKHIAKGVRLLMEAPKCALGPQDSVQGANMAAREIESNDAAG